MPLTSLVFTYIHTCWWQILWEMSVMSLVFLSFLTHSFLTIGPPSLWEAADGSLVLYTILMFRDGFQYPPHRMMVYAVTALGYLFASFPFLLGSTMLPAPTGYDKAGNTRRVLTEGMKHAKWDREHTRREGEVDAEAEDAEDILRIYMCIHTTCMHTPMHTYVRTYAHTR